MKKFATREALQIAAANEADIFDVHRFFGDAAAAWLLDAVNRKKLSAHSIFLDGTEKYLVIWHRDAQDRCFVNCAIERNGGGDFTGFLRALESLARTHRCIGIAGNATRQGLLKKLLERGYLTHGVCVHYDF